MWDRLKRMIRSIVGAFIELGESPELILRQNIKDMEDQIPAMNQNIAMIRASLTLLEKEKARLEGQERDLSSKIKASLKTNRRDLALNFATTLEQVRADLVSTDGQLKVAKEAYDKGQTIKTQYMRTIERKSKEAMSAIQSRQRAEWQGKIADAMDSFKVAGIDATHDEMLRKVEAEAATKEAQMHVALDNMDHQAFEVEREAQKLEANDTLRQFEMEMGLSAPESIESGSTEKVIGPETRQRDRA